MSEELPHRGILLKRSRASNLFSRRWQKRVVELTVVEKLVPFSTPKKELALKYYDLSRNLKGEMTITGVKAVRNVDSKHWCFAATSREDGGKRDDEWEGLLTTTEFVVFSAEDQKQFLEWTCIIEGALADICQSEGMEAKEKKKEDPPTTDDIATWRAQAIESERKMAQRWDQEEKERAERIATAEAERIELERQRDEDNIQAVSRLRTTSRRLSGLGGMGVSEDVTEVVAQFGLAMGLLAWVCIILIGNIVATALTIYFLVVNEGKGGACADTTGRAIWIYTITRMCLLFVSNQCKVKEPTEDNKFEQYIASCCSGTIHVGVWIYGGLVIYGADVCDEFKRTGLYKLISNIFIIDVALGSLTFAILFWVWVYRWYNGQPLPPNLHQAVQLDEAPPDREQEQDQGQHLQRGEIVEKVPTAPLAVATLASDQVGETIEMANQV